MKIGIDASRANNERKTGVEWYAFCVIQELKKLVSPDISVDLYTREKLRGGLEVIPAHWRERVLSWTPRLMWTQARLSAEVALHRPRALFIPAHVMPLLHPKRTVVTIHDVAFKRLRYIYPARERLYQDFTVRQMARESAHIITPSQTTKNDLREFFSVPEEKISVVPHGFSSERYRLLPITVAERQEYTPEALQILAQHKIRPPFFMSIGRLEAKKNTAHIIRAFIRFRDAAGKQGLPPHQLVLVGKPGFGWHEIVNWRDFSEYRTDIIIPGFVPEEEVPVLMNAASGFLFPSLYEGFGIPVLEAQACGVPVITSRVAALPEVAGKGALYVDPHNVDELAEQMLCLAGDKELSKQLSLLGLENVQRFSWERAGEQTWEVLRQTI